MTPPKPPTLRRATRVQIVRVMVRSEKRARKKTTYEYEYEWVRAQGLEIRLLSETFLDGVLSEVYACVSQNAPTPFTSTLATSLQTVDPFALW